VAIRLGGYTVEANPVAQSMMREIGFWPFTAINVFVSLFAYTFFRQFPVILRIFVGLNAVVVLINTYAVVTALSILCGWEVGL
jgi:hypothetical protein